MDALAKIEISFAALRDRLYVERIEETCKESAMILDGTHPELIFLTNLIEARKRRRLEVIEAQFEEQERQFSRVAKSDEQAIWSTWRVSTKANAQIYSFGALTQVILYSGWHGRVAPRHDG